MSGTYSLSYYKRKVREEVAKIRANNAEEVDERVDEVKRVKLDPSDDDTVYGEDEDPERRADFKNKLRKWALDSGTPPKHLNSLLTLLVDFLPFDPPKSADKLLTEEDLQKYQSKPGTRGVEMSMAEMMVKMDELQKDMAQIKKNILPQIKLKYPLNHWKSEYESDFVSFYCNRSSSRCFVFT